MFVTKIRERHQPVFKPCRGSRSISIAVSENRKKTVSLEPGLIKMIALRIFLKKLRSVSKPITFRTLGSHHHVNEKNMAEDGNFANNTS